jgi:hypothetical protein
MQLQLMRCNHCPFGSLGQFLQLFQRRLFGPFGPRTEFSMGSMWNVPTCSIKRARFFIPGIVAKTLNAASVGLPSWVPVKFNLMAVFVNSNFPSRNGVGRFAIRTRCVKTEINSCPLADISVVGWRKGFGRVYACRSCGSLMGCR